MSEAWIRILIALAVIAAAVLVAFVSSRIRKPVHPSVVVGDIGDRPGVVMFTSTDCSTCKRAIERLKSASIPFREVTHELEPHRLEAWEVVAVPLTVFLNASSEAVSVLTGVPSKRAVAAGARKAGIEGH
jgi:glutaredoxin